MDPAVISSAMTVLDGPLGPIHVAASKDAILALEMRSTDDAFVRGIARRTGAPPGSARSAGVAIRRLLDLAGRHIDAYWAGDPTALQLPVGLVGLPAWDRRVLSAVRRVPYGRATSYGRIGLAIGAPRAARAVGGAVGRNPIGLLIPCHRVVAGDGSIGGYGGGRTGTIEEQVELKRTLLIGEGIVLPVRDLLVPW
ncbi:MAG TPA: methylated-DNA--[protein]-cysteine S-methyltransferase [Candidatus Limnocylindrales bacterium]|nr:methylated-DNA--[protein]-cysteine S-methyltransferase [Candidatus Limnocylindrales bacterium]